MANVLTSFLIGIGMDTRELERGAKRFDSAMTGMGTKTLQTSAALVGAFGAVGLAVINSNDKINRLTLATAGLQTGTKEVMALGGAFRSVGGDADAALGNITAMESKLREFQIKGQVSDEAAYAGLTGEQIRKIYGAKSGIEMARELAKVVPTMDRPQQKLLQADLGLSDEMMALLRTGDKFNATMVEMNKQLQLSSVNTDKVNALSAAMGEFTNRADGLANVFSAKFTPALIGILGHINQFLAHPSLINMTEKAGENPAAAMLIGSGVASLAGGAGAMGVGKMIGSKALTHIGGGALRGGAIGAGVGLGMLGYDLMELDKPLPKSAGAPGRFGRPSGNIPSMTPHDMATRQRERDDARQQGQAARFGNVVNNRPVQVNVGKVELDGREVGRFVDQRVEITNSRTLADMGGTVER